MRTIVDGPGAPTYSMRGNAAKKARGNKNFFITAKAMRLRNFVA